jgi:predicted nucleic acid-binding protein
MAATSSYERVLLDTNVISEFARPDNKPDQRVKEWLEAADPNSLYASVLTFSEIRRGIEKLAPGKRRTRLETWLAKDFSTSRTRNDIIKR